MSQEFWDFFSVCRKSSIQKIPFCIIKFTLIWKIAISFIIRFCRYICVEKTKYIWTESSIPFSESYKHFFLFSYKFFHTIYRRYCVRKRKIFNLYLIFLFFYFFEKLYIFRYSRKWFYKRFRFPLILRS